MPSKHKKPSEALPTDPYKGRSFIVLRNITSKETLSVLYKDLGIDMDEIFEFREHVHACSSSFESCVGLL